MILNKENLDGIRASEKIRAPGDSVFKLPEKVLQFGTGVLLRGLPDYFIDKANRSSIFNGRVAVVKSTGRGSSREFVQQDGLYTIGVRGIENGHKVEEDVICSAISRVLHAETEWNEVLALAGSEELQIVISNTTEVGIQLIDDDIRADPPKSFPGKLLAVLYERFKAFGGAKERGLVIIPTELISDNGNVLKQIVFALAKQNDLEDSFFSWLETANTFCSSLVDRIVPGRPDEATLRALEDKLGYTDELLIIAEAYRLWAIEGDEKIKDILSFEQTDAGVVITPDISMFKELKLRLLNGSHTLTCGIAVLSGFDTVHAALSNAQFSEFIATLLREDLAQAIPHPVPVQEALHFAGNVLDRFRNPDIKHHWLNISVNYTLKLKTRVIPVLIRYYNNFNKAPTHIAFGFAAYFLFMRSKQDAGQFHGVTHLKLYKLDDEQAGYYSDLWLHANSPDEVVDQALSNVQLWDTDLSALPGFGNAIKEYLRAIEELGVMEGIKRISSITLY